MQRKTLGGDRLGSGKKMKVDLHGYERSTHDLSYLWRSTMSAGTLVPFMSEIGLPGDTFDIDLDCDIKTLPTAGPLFGSYKVQLDTFVIPIRLYNAVLHNNKLGIGLEMEKVYFPILEFVVPQMNDWNTTADKDNSQINPSCILKYLGLSGVGFNDDAPNAYRTFNAIPLLAYWDIYKQYYANKQEELGAVIHNQSDAGGSLSAASINGVALPSVNGLYMGSQDDEIIIVGAGGAQLNLNYVLFRITSGAGPAIDVSANELGHGWVWTGADWRGTFNIYNFDQVSVYSARIAGATDSVTVEPQVSLFDLNNIDTMRETILTNYSIAGPFNVSTYVEGASLEPYAAVAANDNYQNRLASQEGLAIKTYQSDLFNNWLKTEYITAINQATAIDTTGASFTMDQLQLAKKVYDLLNRVAVSGGTYGDWIEAVYDQNKYWQAETPMYMGGLIKELVFQEIVSNAKSEDEALGTLAGKGVLTNKHKGGQVYIKIEEPSYIMGIISLTPRVDYSQGNKWDVHLQTMDDLHKPGLDGIGFQDLITEQLAWWSTTYNLGGAAWVQQSAGKQPAWLNYMTNVNRCYGNFAVPSKEMYMTLNRRYEDASGSIGDLTTYIDPAKFNFIFAETNLDAQNFWAQIAVNITARRKMSAKIMPNL